MLEKEDRKEYFVFAGKSGKAQCGADGAVSEQSESVLPNGTFALHNTSDNGCISVFPKILYQGYDRRKRERVKFAIAEFAVADL